MKDHLSKKDIPLGLPDIRNDDIERVVKVLQSGNLVQGSEVAELEGDLSHFCSSDYASVVSSGTASLHLALVALGIGQGDEVIVPAFSFIATANVVELVGASCVFVDIDLRTFNIDESLLPNKITSKTKAIIPVHEFGLCANMDAIMEIANKYNLKVIEDAACALGSYYNNKHAGTFGDFGSFSFHPRKSVTSGEGGCLITNDPFLNEQVKVLRNHGIATDKIPMDFTMAGFNYRLTDIQAALLFAQLERLQDALKHKEKLAFIYLNEIDQDAVALPWQPPNTKHAWQTFHVLLPSNEDREQLKSYLKSKGVMTNYGAQCIPSMSYYDKKYNLNAELSFPNAYKAYHCGLAIPIYTKLQEQQVKYISDTINNYFK